MFLIYGSRWKCLNFAIYSRKSVFTGKGESIENQVEMCKQYIFSKFDNVSDNNIRIYEDEGFSGKNTDRPQFQKMINDIKQKEINCVVCYRLDRISRSVSDFSSLIEELSDRNISFISIKEEFDTSTPMGKAMMYIASVFAQLERETLAERVHDNMLMLARDGRWLGGTTPMGFTSEKVNEIFMDGKAKYSCKLKINLDEIKIIKVIYNKFLELRSLSGISKYMIKQNIKNRHGKYFSVLGIKEILQNPVYCIADKDARNYFIAHKSDVSFREDECSEKYGLLSYNKRDYKKKPTPRQPINKWIIAKGKHKGIICGKQWIAVQNILDENKPNNKAIKTHNDYSLLSGMIICSKCNGRMFSKIRNNNRNLYDYICQNKMRGGTSLCDCPNLNGQQADDTVCKYLFEYTDEKSDICKYLQKLKNDLKNETETNDINILETRINKRTQEMDNLIETLSQKKLSTALIKHINQKVAALDNEIKQLNNEKAELQSNIKNTSQKKIQLNMIATALSSLKNNFQYLTISEKRTLIKLLVKKIEWNGKDLHIFIYGE